MTLREKILVRQGKIPKTAKMILELTTDKTWSIISKQFLDDSYIFYDNTEVYLIVTRENKMRLITKYLLNEQNNPRQSEIDITGKILFSDKEILLFINAIAQKARAEGMKFKIEDENENVEIKVKIKIWY